MLNSVFHLMTEERIRSLINQWSSSTASINSSFHSCKTSPPPLSCLQSPSRREEAVLLEKEDVKGYSEFLRQYASAINNYQKEGYSGRVPDEDVSSIRPIWYLPHHAVWHPRKPNKPWVVFDCACKFEGVSVNNQLLQGPGNTISLIGGILRLRVNSGRGS